MNVYEQAVSDAILDEAAQIGIANLTTVSIAVVARLFPDLVANAAESAEARSALTLRELEIRRICESMFLTEVTR
jgi:hypothetical protein